MEGYVAEAGTHPAQTPACPEGSHVMLCMSSVFVTYGARCFLNYSFVGAAFTHTE